MPTPSPVASRTYQSFMGLLPMLLNPGVPLLDSPHGLGPLPSLLPGGQAGPLQYSEKHSSVPFAAFKVAYGSSYLSLPTTDSFPSPKPQLVIFPRENNSGFLKKPLQGIQSPLRVLP